LVDSNKKPLPDLKDRGSELDSSGADRLRFALDLLAIPVAAITGDNQLVVNSAFAQQMSHPHVAAAENDQRLRRRVIAILDKAPPADSVRWIDGKRCWDDQFKFANKANETNIWHVRISVHRHNSSSLRQLQIVSKAEATALGKSSSVETDLAEFVLQSDIPMLIRDDDDYRLINQALAEMLGYESEAEIRRTVQPFGLVSQSSREEIHDRIRRRNRNEEVSKVVSFKMLHKDGSDVWVRGYGRTITWAGKSALLSVLINVTDEFQTIADLQKSERRFSQVCNVAPFSLFIHRNGKPLYVNSAMVQLSGMNSEQEFLALDTFWSLFVDEERARDMSKRRMAGSDAPLAYEIDFRPINRPMIKVRVVAHRIEWNGEPAVLGCLTDVTDLTDALNRLQLEEQKLRDFGVTAATWFWETEEKHRITMISNDITVVTGRPVEEFVGKTRRELYPDHRIANPESWARYESALENREPFNDFEVEFDGADGALNSVKLSGVPVFDSDGVFTGYRGSARDVTEENRLQKKVAYAATHDELTGLANRRMFANLVDQAIERVADSQQVEFLAFLDLDGFKIVNDTAGHSFGDDLLVQCSELFQQLMRFPDIVARLGGDEFGFLFRQQSLDSVVTFLEKLIAQLSRRQFVYEDRVMEVGASIGLVKIGVEGVSREHLISQADVACYAAKDLGRNRVYVFRESDKDARRRLSEVTTASDIQQAIFEQRMQIHAQSIVDLHDSAFSPVHNEVLVRMKRLDGEVAQPGDFIPAAERHHLSHSLDRYMVNHSLEMFARAHGSRAGKPCRVGLSVNLSGDTLSVENFDDFVLDALNRHGVAPQNVCFEVTETMAIRNLDLAMRFIKSTRAIGCRVSLDDFGAGLSSFAYLKDFDIDQIKIDGRFVRNVLNEKVDQEIVSSITRIGDALSVAVVAEHIEDYETAKLIRALGVDYGQGYLWGKPAPYADQLRTQEDP